MTTKPVYNDSRLPNFFQPDVTQHGSHMVITNVAKPSKIKYVNIDTRFRDEYDYYTDESVASHTVTLPERLTNIKSMLVTNIEIPLTIYNISSARHNNTMVITEVEPPHRQSIVVLPNENFTTIDLLVDAINLKLSSVPFNSLSFSKLADGRLNMVNTDTSTDLVVSFDTLSSSSESDKYRFKSKLGWLLGFRRPSYTAAKNVSSTLRPVRAEALPDLQGPRYLFLAVDEFSQGNHRSFISPTDSSMTNKNILARITIPRNTYDFGNVLMANTVNGLLLTDRRAFMNNVNILRMNLQLIDEWGYTVCLNGMDFSFCLEILHD